MDKSCLIISLRNSFKRFPISVINNGLNFPYVPQSFSLVVNGLNKYLTDYYYKNDIILKK